MKPTQTALIVPVPEAEEAVAPFGRRSTRRLLGECRLT